MSERKSPPGPREIIQEHQFVHSLTGIAFEQETEPEGGGGSQEDAQRTAGVGNGARRSTSVTPGS